MMTKNDLESSLERLYSDAEFVSRRTLRSALLSLGISLGSAEWQAAMTLAQAIRRRAEDDWDRLRLDEEAARISPYINDAKERMPTASEAEIIAAATADADLADEEAEELAGEEEAERADRALYIATRGAIEEQAQAIESALRIEDSEGFCGSKCSFYARFRGITLRISDHAQVDGGGVDQETGERNGEADVQWVVRGPEDVVHDAAAIRMAVAGSIRESRI